MLLNLESSLWKFYETKSDFENILEIIFMKHDEKYRHELIRKSYMVNFTENREIPKVDESYSMVREQNVACGQKSLFVVVLKSCH